MSLYPEPPRPRMCPEARCRPLIQWPGYTKEQLDVGVREWEPGESWVCWGVMSEPVVYVYDGEDHPNDCRTCTFTPAKGLIAFQENREDWWVLQHRYAAALEQLDAYRGVLVDGGKA